MIPEKRAYDYDHEGEVIRLELHCDGVVHEPRVRWQVGDQVGTHGYTVRHGSESVVRLEAGTVRLNGRVVRKLPVPSEIADALQTARKRVGTVVPEAKRVVTDPSVFPDTIAGYERVGWEPGRNVMWYDHKDQPGPRAYQIETGELVFRAEEWADDVASTDALIDEYNLRALPS